MILTVISYVDSSPSRRACPLPHRFPSTHLGKTSETAASKPRAPPRERPRRRCAVGAGSELPSKALPLKQETTPVRPLVLLILLTPLRNVEHRRGWAVCPRHEREGGGERGSWWGGHTRLFSTASMQNMRDSVVTSKVESPESRENVDGGMDNKVGESWLSWWTPPASRLTNLLAINNRYAKTSVKSASGVMYCCSTAENTPSTCRRCSSHTTEAVSPPFQPNCLRCSPLGKAAHTLAE